MHNGGAVDGHRAERAAEARPDDWSIKKKKQRPPLVCLSDERETMNFDGGKYLIKKN